MLIKEEPDKWGPDKWGMHQPYPDTPQFWSSSRYPHPSSHSQPANERSLSLLTVRTSSISCSCPVFLKQKQKSTLVQTLLPVIYTNMHTIARAKFKYLYNILYIYIYIYYYILNEYKKFTQAPRTVYILTSNSIIFIRHCLT